MKLKITLILAVAASLFLSSCSTPNTPPQNLDAGLLESTYYGYFDQNLEWFTEPNREVDLVSEPLATTIVEIPETPSDLFTLVYEGYFKPNSTGKWTFETVTDTENYLWIGPTAVIDTTLENADLAIVTPEKTVSKSITFVMEEDTLYPIKLLWGSWSESKAVALHISNPEGKTFVDLEGLVFNAGEEKNKYLGKKPETAERTSLALLPDGGEELTAKDDFSSAQKCMLANQNPDQLVANGFPIPEGRLALNEQIQTKVVYVNFSDTNQSDVQSPQENFSRFQEFSEDFYGEMSGKKLAFNWDINPEYINLPNPVTAYGSGRDIDGQRIIEDAIVQSDGAIDFSGTDMLVIVLSPSVSEQQAGVSPAYPQNALNPFVTNEGNILNATLLAGDAHRVGPGIFAHEVGHLLGLQDFYAFSAASWEVQDQFPYLGGFDLMNNVSGGAERLLAWNRFNMGWMSDEQVSCIEEPGEYLVSLQNNEMIGDSSNLVILKLSGTTAIGIESIRQSKYCESCQAGVLVYFIDTTIRSGFGPVRIFDELKGSDPYMFDSILSQGQEIQLGNVLIQSEKANLSADLIRVTLR
jgi:M6 family metalloprotease-like protein